MGEASVPAAGCEEQTGQLVAGMLAHEPSAYAELCRGMGGNCTAISPGVCRGTANLPKT